MTPDAFRLIDEIPEDANVLFHPSACQPKETLQNLPFDRVLLCSNGLAATEKRGRLICLKEDNNAVVGALLRRAAKLSALTVIRDGCSEGGNYECVMNPAFLARILPLASDAFVVHQDHWPGMFSHGSVLQERHFPAAFHPTETPSWLSLLEARSNPIGSVRSWTLRPPNPLRQIAQHEDTRYSVQRESLWSGLLRHRHETAGVLYRPLGRGGRRAMKAFATGLWPEPTIRERRLRLLDDDGGDPGKDIEWALAAGLKHLLIGPTGPGRSKALLDAAVQAGDPGIPVLHFYHLQASDHSDLRHRAGGTW